MYFAPLSYTQNKRILEEELTGARRAPSLSIRD